MIRDAFEANTKIVVPHEGTWIEIKQKRTSSSTKNVVPHEGTWIEIRYKAAASS